MLMLIALAALAPAAESVRIPTQDGGLIYGDVYGSGKRAVILLHGGRFKRESWAKQAQVFAERGFAALAIDFRGEGLSRGGPQSRGDNDRYQDVLAAVRYARSTGARTVSVVGASMGGDYAAEASEAEPQAIDRLVLLAAGAYTPLIRTTGGKLFIMSRDDVMGDDKKPRLPGIRAAYEKASSPKELVLLTGSAHAQYIFATDQGERLMREIIRFLSAP